MNETEPRYPVDDKAERERFLHHIEWPRDGWEYRSTRVAEADHPNGWDPTPPDKSWELNVDRWPLLDETDAGWTRVSPGVLRTGSVTSAQLVAHWRRKR